jgi:methylated-DNA-protein-cysteine methyltransferase related protein
MQYSDNTRSFFQDVYEIVRLIPKGRVTTYGAIAEYLGSRGSSRMVGWAMNAAHGQYPPVPAQRVVNRNGLLTGRHHFETPDRMQQLLEHEGVVIKNHQVVEMGKVFWNPTNELI